MELINNLYNLSPTFIQNILITGYGYKLKKQRYGNTFRRYYKELLESQYYSSEELDNLQFKYFEELLVHATSHVPFYRDIVSKERININEVNLNNYTSYFPVITKELLRTRTNDFITTENIHEKLISNFTSGSSGTPLKVATSISALQRNYAFFNRFLTWAGVKYGDRCATFAGRVFIPPKQSKPPYWRYNLASNTLLLSSYHISPENITYYIRALEKFNPVFIDSYPSAIYQLAKHIVVNNHKHKITLSAIITSSETLFDYQRTTIEKAFNCKVYDHLGCAEMSTFITQCEHGKYHVNPEYGLIEVLDDDDNPVAPGEPGKLICTGLFNNVMPLIRYKLGDTIILSSDKCQCGRNFPVVKSILGRTDDLIIGCDGRKIGRLDPIFKKLDGTIKETQIIQTDLSNIIIKIAAEENYNKQNTAIILSELKARVGDCMNFKVEYVSSIPKSSSGKFKTVVSLVNKD